MPHGRRPKPPYPGFPLFAHAAGQWAKKIRGRTVYFGAWSDWRAALERYQAERDDLYAGRKPRRHRPGGVTVDEAVNRFLADRRDRVRAGELAPRSYADYYRDAAAVLGAFGRDRPAADLGPADFAELRAAAAGRLGPAALASFVQRVRTCFKFAFDSGLIDTPIRYGPGFAKPAARVMRLHRAAVGPRTIEAADLRRLIDAAPVQLRAMILLGVNCGFGQTDCARLPRAAVRGGWIDYPRPKTGIARRCPLWPETAAALEAVAGVRPKPTDPKDDGLVFVTRFGLPWVRYKPKGHGGTLIDSAGEAFADLCAKVGLGRRGFYDLRRTFLTAADAARDPVAAGIIMGHHDASMAAVYRQRVDDERLIKVVQHVRAWLRGE